MQNSWRYLKLEEARQEFFLRFLEEFHPIDTVILDFWASEL
jgi:hypothetical protein